MIRTRSVIKTLHAGKYLVQLSKHWQHKFSFSYTETEAHIPFSDAIRLDMSANPAELAVQLEAPNEEDIARMETVFANHLERFAFREKLIIDWQRETLP
ncbi:MAG: Hypothetical protein BHV28_04150 [Candidatus Tokpelaia hoelldobleri]|uniref:DUF2218 domain-containing protein n=1 Tax=Candidatus Tokpelaia hoelldobleri TaxID=1902579 RepID=A0A1U9JTD9_9HYPH|nr:MAG: Hypothetical protein BHV28_04150 [Candidatus Tokpelaia hoelldoblerii]